jgi:hypothetical protein
VKPIVVTALAVPVARAEARVAETATAVAVHLHAATAVDHPLMLRLRAQLRRRLQPKLTVMENTSDQRRTANVVALAVAALAKKADSPH